MRIINRIIESWRSWRRWSAVDRGLGDGSAEALVDRGLRDGAPREEFAGESGAMRGRVLSRILSESSGGVSVGTPRVVGVVRDRIGWVVGGCALASVVVIAGLVAFRAASPRPAPSQVATTGVDAEVSGPESRGVEFRLASLDMPVQRLIRSVSGEPLEEEARRLMSDVKRAAAALQGRLPDLRFAENGRGGGGGSGM